MAVMEMGLVLGRADESWLAENSTLIVGVVGIIVSGVVGPGVAAWLSGKREREKDARAHAAARRDDLRALVDEAARALGTAVARLRPALDAQLKGQPLPTDARDFLAELFTLGQRLRLRAKETSPVVTAYDNARKQLIELSQATTSQNAFETAADEFDNRRATFLDEARQVLDAPISDGRQ